MAINRCGKCGKIIKGIGVLCSGKYYHKDCLVCSYCGGKLTGSFVTIGNQLFHPECNPASGKLVCAYCRKHIEGSYVTLDGKNYHCDCYHNHIEKKCSVCGKPIGNGTYTYDEWGNYAHLTHGSQKTRFCFSCQRIISGPSKLIATNTELCSVCAISSVTSASQVEACRKKVLSIFKSVGILGIPENIPIILQSKDLMGDALGYIRSSKSGFGKSYDFSIFMTNGLPELHFQGVLAHELLHSWLMLYGREVTEDECEGFCNLGSALVYEKTGTDFSVFLLKKEYKNKDRIYGDGYRLQKGRFEKLGWSGLLDSLKHK